MKLTKKIYNNSITALKNNKLSSVIQNLKKIDEINSKEKNKSFKIGIARTFTIESQINFIKLAISILPANIKIKLGVLNNIEQELINQNSNLLSWKPDLIIVLWRFEELLPDFVENFDNFKQKADSTIMADY